MKQCLVFILMLSLIFSASAAVAQVPEPVINENPSEETYWEDTGNKALNGTANVLLGWTQPLQDLRTNDGSKNLINLILDSVITGLSRTAAGAVQLATLVFPQVEWEGDAELALN